MEMRTGSPVATREQPQVPPGNWKGGLTPFLQLESFPLIPVATREEPRASCCNLRKTTRSPRNTKLGGISLQRLESNPEFPLATRKEVRLPFCNLTGSPDPCHNSRGTPSFLMQQEISHEIPPQLKMRPDSPAAAREQSRVPPCN